MITRLRRLLRVSPLAGTVIGAAYLSFHYLRTRRWIAGSAVILGIVTIYLIGNARRFAAIGMKTQTKASYVITDLGALPGGNGESAASAINDDGQIVGSSNVDGTTKERAFLWQEGKMFDLGALLDGYSYASGISDDGLIVGQSSKSDGHFKAVVWRNRAMRILDVGGADSGANGVNRKGVVVGSIGFGHNFGQNAFSWRNDRSEVLGDFSAHSVNNAGEVAGFIISPRDTEAVVYRNGTVHCLPAFDKDQQSRAYAINDKGQIAGWISLAGGGGSAVLWEKDKIKTLGGLGGSSAYADAINNQTQIVGFAETTQGQRHAFIWQNDKMTDLNDLVPRLSGWTLIDASSINKRGQIVGTGEREGKRRAFLLTP